MLRAGVIGVGSIGQHHARNYNSLDNVELVAVADPDEGRRNEIARRFKTTTYADYRAMLTGERLDLVSIAVPTVLHHQVALDALEKNIHVLIEKPIASTIDEAVGLIQKARERELVLTVGHIERYNPAVRELKKRLESGELGRIFQLHARRLSPFPKYIRDVGVVMDLATHELDIMWYLIKSEIQHIFAETRQNIHKQHEDMLLGILNFENGVVGVLDINWLTPTKVRELWVTGEAGLFHVDYISQDLYFYENSETSEQWDAMALFKGVGEGNVLKYKINKEEPMAAELRDFARVVETGGTPTITGMDGLRALGLAKLLIQSAQERSVIGVDVDAIEQGWSEIELEK